MVRRSLFRFQLPPKTRFLTLRDRHTGIVAFGTEWYWAGTLRHGPPVRIAPSLTSEPTGIRTLVLTPFVLSAVLGTMRLR